MIISHRKKFVLFAPWKTASSTIHLRLAPVNDSPYDRFYNFNPYLNRVVHQHMTCVEFCSLPESRLGYFTGSFIRNPYDRVYSGFRQLQTQVQQQPQAEFSQSWIKDLVMRQLTKNFSQLCQAGFEFNKWLELLREYQIYEVGHNTSFPLHPAHYWTHIKGEQFVDFIGQVEAFEEDFNAFCKKVGVDQFDRANANIVVDPAGFRNAGYKYVDRMTRKSIDKINALFKDDFEIFGYARC
jgi:Sulfotransferase family